MAAGFPSQWHVTTSRLWMQPPSPARRPEAQLPGTTNNSALDFEIVSFNLKLISSHLSSRFKPGATSHPVAPDERHLFLGGKRGCGRSQLRSRCDAFARFISNRHNNEVAL
jgi:hypothetical protein